MGKTKYGESGDCAFFSALLGTVILLCFLFILGVPKFVIALEYWSQCPEYPVIPVYLCVTGLLGVGCVAHSAFLWSCLYRRRMMRKTSHDCCLVLWVILMLIVAVLQLTASPFIIYKYRQRSNTLPGCDVISHITTPSILNSSNSHNSSFHNGTLVVADKNTSDIGYTINPVIRDKNITIGRNDRSDPCFVCSDVVMTCAYVTAIIEVVFMGVPMICLVIAAVVFRIRNRDTLQRK